MSEKSAQWTELREHLMHAVDQHGNVQAVLFVMAYENDDEQTVVDSCFMTPEFATAESAAMNAEWTKEVAEKMRDTAIEVLAELERQATEKVGLA